MDSTNRIELDEFDEIAFGLTPQSGGSMENPLQFLNSKQPPQLRLPSKSAAASSSVVTKIPMDGLFSDEEDENLFPVFGKTASKAPVVKDAPAAAKTEKDETVGKSILKSLPAPRPTEKIPSVTFSQNVGNLSNSSSKGDDKSTSNLSNLLSKKDTITGSSGDSISLNNKAPIRSSLFKNLATPSWEKKDTVTIDRPPEAIVTSTNLSQTEIDKQRKAMLFGGSVANSSLSSSVTSNEVQPSAHVSTAVNVIPSDSLSLAPAINSMVSGLLQESKAAEEEDIKRVASYHDFLRQQTQQAVQSQQTQADQFLKQFMAENKRQLETHLQRIKNGFSILGASPPDHSGQILTPDDLSRKNDILEKRLEEREIQIQKYSQQLLQLEDQHREEVREMRIKFDEALSRSSTVHHEFVIGLQSSHESIRKQYEESLTAMREALTAKSSLEAVRGSVEQSSQELAAWRHEFERKQDLSLREKDHLVQMRDRQIAELSALMQTQIDNWKGEREMLQKRLDQETTRVLKRESDLEEQQHDLQRERLEFESEKGRFRNQQSKELQRLEKRLEDTLIERQNALEAVAEEKHTVEIEKRNLKETIRAIEEKYALELKKKQLNLESAMEHVVAEQRLLVDKTQNMERERTNLKEQRERLEREKLELVERKIKLDKHQGEMERKDQELQETVLLAARMKQEGERALNEARFMDEEHKNRVAKLNLFLEQLRQKELGLMRKAIENNMEGGHQRAIQLPNGTLAVVPRQTSDNALRVQLLPNPAHDYSQQNWQSEKDYLRNLKNTSWNKNTR